jgi:tetratricopeptide (TPR) repeat protein
MGYSKLRQTYFVLGRYGDAVSVCRQMISLDPQGQNRYIDLGVLFERLNMADSAFTLYREALKENPAFYKIHDRLGTLFFNRNLPDSAEQHYRLAIEISKEYANAYFNLGMLYYSQGKSSMALSTLSEGMRYGDPPQGIQVILKQLNAEKINSGQPDAQ